MYKVDSPQAEEFIHHEEILETLEYARSHKDNRAFIEQLIEKAALCKGLTHREAATLLESNRSFTATVSLCSHRFTYRTIA